MAEIKREDITLSDWTKGISADEFAGGSYYYSEGISSGYNTKGFELGYNFYNTAINVRDKGYAVALEPSSYGFMAFTRDGRLETENKWNSMDGGGDDDGGGALYAYVKGGYLGNGYLNGIRYGKYAIGIRQTTIDVLDYDNLFDPYSELLSSTVLADEVDWVIGNGWNVSTDGAAHETGETDPLSIDVTSAGLTNTDMCRCAVKIYEWTAGYLDVDLGGTSERISGGGEGWFVVSVPGIALTTTLTITPSSTFDGIVEIVNLHQYDTSKINTYSCPQGFESDSLEHRPALVWEGDLYVACGARINIISLSDWGVQTQDIIDENYEIKSLTQQAGYIIIWASNGYDSRQYYWNGVDAVATEVIEWKGLIIQGVKGTETMSYVLTTSGSTSGSINGYEYRLYAVSGYQRQLISSKLYQYNSGDYIETDHYNANKKFDFNDVTNDHSMAIFLDSLYIPGCDGVYKYGYDIPGLKNAWTRPIKYETGSTEIVLGQMGNFLGVAYRNDGINYIGGVDNRIYTAWGYLVTESIYWDKLSTRKALEKLKIGFKNVASSVGGIKIYAIVDDNYFWRFRPTSTPTTRPSVGAVYQVANDTTAEVIAVDKDEGVITLRTVSDTGSYLQTANTTLTKVSGDGDDTISVGYNFDNMCLIKTIESEKQGYGSEFIFGKDFVNSYLPYRYKIQFVIELYSDDNKLSPEIFEISMVSDITDTIL